MASKKFYGYYMKGNKLALIEKDVSTSGSDLSAEDYGKYKSPKTSVDNGLEIEYTYSPTYTLAPHIFSAGGAGQSGGGASFHVFGWTVVSGYLTFVTQSFGEDLSDSTYDDELGTAGTDDILIEGSDRWNGIHRVKTRGTEGLLVTETKVPSAKVSSTIGHVFDNTADDIEQGGDAVENSFQALLTSGETSYIVFQTYPGNALAEEKKSRENSE